ncbi:MAG: hypothetical protein PHY14_03095 [Candidatus Gracilibacteria bacterium]|nr:hypothetical protein [Candidatus Gracilibacteria bacterium]
MISVICTNDVRVRDGFANALSLEKVEDTSTKIMYQKGKWVLIFFRENFSKDDLDWITSSYIPDRIYLPYFGTSIDVMHEVGDIIVPNVFFSYNPRIESIEISEENRDSLMEGVQFLTHLEEQKDYYVEDFGLSVGGIIVQNAPEKMNDELMTKLMLVYEADIYAPSDIQGSIEMVQDENIPSIILCGTVEGKVGKYQGTTPPVDFVIRNMITTIRLLEDEA